MYMYDVSSSISISGKTNNYNFTSILATVGNISLYMYIHATRYNNFDKQRHKGIMIDLILLVQKGVHYYSFNRYMYIYLTSFYIFNLQVFN